MVMWKKENHWNHENTPPWMASAQWNDFYLFHGEGRLNEWIIALIGFLHWGHNSPLTGDKQPLCSCIWLSESCRTAALITTRVVFITGLCVQWSLRRYPPPPSDWNKDVKVNQTMSRCPSASISGCLSVCLWTGSKPPCHNTLSLPC